MPIFCHGRPQQQCIYGASYASETIQSVSFLSENLAGDFTFDLTAVAAEEDLAIEGADAALVKTNVSNTLSVGVSGGFQA
ncbi:MAG: hypothetical protein E7111_06490 [Bacteroidales bacterium]|nr:hypothetical protein [Bacteroidales bacterium]